MGAIVIRTRYDEGTESAEVIVAILKLIRGAQCLIEVIRSSGEEM
jgi:hypothetical protein